MFDTYEEHCSFTYATDAEMDQYGATLYGQSHADEAWICSDRDVWYPNPYYTGPEVRHPEDYDEEDYIVGQHAVNLYEDDKAVRLHHAWDVGRSMVELYYDITHPVPF